MLFFASAAPLAAKSQDDHGRSQFGIHRVVSWLIRRVENPKVPGSRLARVGGTPDGALVV